MHFTFNQNRSGYFQCNSYIIFIPSPSIGAVYLVDFFTQLAPLDENVNKRETDRRFTILIFTVTTVRQFKTLYLYRVSRRGIQPPLKAFEPR